MADRVEYTMERMLPDLLALEKKEVFSRKEIKDIIQKRRDFEYRMQSKSVTDVDFLEAIAYEKTLHKKIKERLKEKKDEQKIVKTTSAEYTVVRRIMTIYDRLLARYKTRMDIFKRYIGFLVKEKAYKKLSSAIASYLATDGNNPEAWRIAAYAEYEVNGNSETSRKLFLKALALNKTNESLWAYYLRFELDFIAKIKERERILKSEEQKLKLLGSEEGKTEIDKTTTVETKIDFTVPKIVVDHAIEAITDKDGLAKLKAKMLEEIEKVNGIPLDEIKQCINEKINPQ